VINDARVIGSEAGRQAQCKPGGGGRVGGHDQSIGFNPAAVTRMPT
jgi:hypothetical protein